MPRALNNPNDPISLMNVLKQILPSGTQLALYSSSGTGVERIFVKDKASLAASPFPAVLLDIEEYTGNIQSNALFDGYVPISVRYYDRWEAQSTTIAIIENNIYADLQRMAANIESNNTLAYLGKARAVSIPVYKIKPTAIPDNSIPGIANALYQEMWLFINILPYDTV